MRYFGLQHWFETVSKLTRDWNDLPYGGMLVAKLIYRGLVIGLMCFTCCIHASLLYPKLDIYFQSCWLFFSFISAIMSSNPIIALLANEKLDGDNFIKWKSNINIVLICENQKFVLTEECPPEPPATASRNVREKYDLWQQANNKARCYMLACMSDVLRTKHESMETAY